MPLISYFTVPAGRFIDDIYIYILIQLLNDLMIIDLSNNVHAVNEKIQHNIYLYIQNEGKVVIHYRGIHYVQLGDDI